MCTIYVITLIQISIYFIVVKIITVALGSLLNSHLSIFLEKKKKNHKVFSAYCASLDKYYLYFGASVHLQTLYKYHITISPLL